MSERQAQRQSKRPGSKAILLGIVVLAGAGGMLAAVQEWAFVTFVPGSATVEELSVTGQQMNSALTLISLAVLAAALVLTIAGPGFRRVIGVLISLLGAGLALAALREPLTGASARIEEVSGITGDAQSALIDTMTVTGWPGVAVALGGVLVVAGICVAVLSPKWKQGGRKYEAASEVTRTRVPGAATGDRISDWEALSDGDDPTDGFDDDDLPGERPSDEFRPPQER